MQRNFLVAFTFICGLAMIASFFMPILQGLQDMLSKFGIIVISFSLLLGMGSILVVNVQKIQRRHADTPYSIVLLIAMFVMLVCGIVFGIKPLESRIESVTLETLFDYLFQTVMVPMSSTMFSLLAFFIASAAYRAFRARNVMASLLLIAALVVMSRFNPYLEPLFGEKVNRLSNWLMNVPNLAAQRAIVMGIGLGMVATALKVVLGIERNYMGKG